VLYTGKKRFYSSSAAGFCDHGDELLHSVTNERSDTGILIE
jgi:hypothetical protein